MAAKVKIDESTTVLITPEGLIVDTDRPPRLRGPRLRRSVQRAVAALVDQGHAVKRLRTHTFQASGCEHCLACPDTAARQQLCEVCGCCRSCCAHEGSRESFWWERRSDAEITDLRRRIELLEIDAAWCYSAVRTAERFVAEHGADRLAAVAPHLSLSNRQFAEKTKLVLSAGTRRDLQRVLDAGGVDAARAQADAALRPFQEEIDSLRAEIERLSRSAG